MSIPKESIRMSVCACVCKIELGWNGGSKRELTIKRGRKIERREKKRDREREN